MITDIGTETEGQAVVAVPRYKQPAAQGEESFLMSEQDFYLRLSLII